MRIVDIFMFLFVVVSTALIGVFFTIGAYGLYYYGKILLLFSVYDINISLASLLFHFAGFVFLIVITVGTVIALVYLLMFIVKMQKEREILGVSLSIVVLVVFSISCFSVRDWFPVKIETYKISCLGYDTLEDACIKYEKNKKEQFVKIKNPFERDLAFYDRIYCEAYPEGRVLGYGLDVDC